jgi:ubiquinone biosynthesis protein COQ9
MNDAAGILDTALTLADEQGWEAVRLHRVAAAAGITLDDIRRHYREKDALIDAWFDRADAAALTLAASGELAALTPRERLFRLIMAWLAALAPHHRVTRQMILSKCEPGHLHIQIPAVMRISRTVQWLREAAGFESTFVRRALEETATTAIFVATFCYWLYDDSQNAQRSRAFLDRRLECAEALAHRVYGAGREPGPDRATPTGQDAPRP